MRPMTIGAIAAPVLASAVWMPMSAPRCASGTTSDSTAGASAKHTAGSAPATANTATFCAELRPGSISAKKRHADIANAAHSKRTRALRDDAPRASMRCDSQLSPRLNGAAVAITSAKQRPDAMPEKPSAFSR